MGETNVCRECTLQQYLLQIYYSYLMLFADYRLDSILWSPACARMAIGGDISNFQQLPPALGLGVPVPLQVSTGYTCECKTIQWGGFTSNVDSLPCRSRCHLHGAYRYQ